VYKDGLVFALRKMQHAHYEGELLELRGGFRGAVEERSGEVHEGVDEKGTEIFDDENGAPGDLGSYGD
jgi:hypothetical protein